MDMRHKKQELQELSTRDLLENSICLREPSNGFYPQHKFWLSFHLRCVFMISNSVRSGRTNRSRSGLSLSVFVGVNYLMTYTYSGMGQ